MTQNHKIALAHYSSYHLTWQLAKKMNIKNVHEVPKIQKIILSTSSKQLVTQKNQISIHFYLLELIANQRGLATRTKKSISNFKIKRGLPIGVKLTLRNLNMNQFLNKLIQFNLPKTKNLNLIAQNSFDSKGNFTIGLTDLFIFKEIENEYELFKSLNGINVTVVLNSNNIKINRFLLRGLLFPVELNY
uniref:Ribosomal protein L5 n=1 Tax=Ancoracysta twista TaxID=2044563 RepID=A0A2H4R8X4_9EUKA|nr:ribosomal protein L5 [Ancoracysta twista]ATY40948.1 ribosomal protein L5 [Ancoracysta twista]